MQRLIQRIRAWREPSDANDQTEQAFRSMWVTARGDSTRHPFHPEVLGNLDALLEAVEALPPNTTVHIGNVPTQRQFLVQNRPWIVRRLTREWMRQYVVTEVARVAQIADSADYLDVRARERVSDSHELTVQHRPSGLRVRFCWDDETNIGTIYAKSYRIPSIDPARQGEHEGARAIHDWEGLGITTRLYLHGASLQPAIRWRLTTLTPQSAALRRRLHEVDPWRFAAADDAERFPQDACGWCATNGWAKLDRADFADHP